MNDVGRNPGCETALSGEAIPQAESEEFPVSPALWPAFRNITPVTTSSSQGIETVSKAAPPCDPRAGIGTRADQRHPPRRAAHRA